MLKKKKSSIITSAMLFPCLVSLSEVLKIHSFHIYINSPYYNVSYSTGNFIADFQ